MYINLISDDLMVIHFENVCSRSKTVNSYKFLMRYEEKDQQFHNNPTLKVVL